MATAVTRMRLLIEEGWKYLLVSAVAFLCDYGLLVGLTEFARLNYLVSAAVGFTAGLGITYTLSIQFVFRQRRLKDARLEFTAFAVIGLAGLAINEALMALFVEFLALNYALAKIPTTAVGFLFNFGIRRAFLFTAPNQPGAQ